jgi:hypothetical protein
MRRPSYTRIKTIASYGNHCALIINLYGLIHFAVPLFPDHRFGSIANLAMALLCDPNSVAAWIRDSVVQIKSRL